MRSTTTTTSAARAATPTTQANTTSRGSENAPHWETPGGARDTGYGTEALILALGFGNASLLWLLLLVPLLVGAYVAGQRRRPAYACRFASPALLATVVPRAPDWRRHIPPVAYGAVLAILLVAVARPSIVSARDTEQATVMLVLDTSGSMVATDVQPTRLAAAQRSAGAFLKHVPSPVKVGLVAFASEVRLVTAPTTDRDVVRQGLASLNALGATAMGDAITVAIDAAASSVEVPTALLVLSDGANTLGADPLDVADTAKQRGVTVDTIALGTQEGVANLADGNGGVIEIPVPPDNETLEAVAQRTGGQFFRAPTAADLTSVYSDLGSHLRAEERRRDITGWFAGAAVVLLLAGAVVSLALFSRLP